MNPGREIAAALAGIELDREEEAQRASLKQAMAVVREIPSGTHDRDLTVAQRRALRQMEQARAWLAARREAEAEG
jgi:hypothetical protein